MSDVYDAPRQAQGTDPSAEWPTLDWQDPEQVERWFEGLRNVVLDGLAAGKDATQRFTQRFFSRHEARRRIHEAERSALGLLDSAQRSLPERPKADQPTAAT